MKGIIVRLPPEKEPTGSTAPFGWVLFHSLYPERSSVRSCYVVFEPHLLPFFIYFFYMKGNGTYLDRPRLLGRPELCA